MMKFLLIKIIIVFLFSFFSYKNAFGEKYIEVIKLYDLYSQNILDLDQLNSSLEKMDLLNENIKNLISLRKENIITEDDFINGIKKIINSINLNEEVAKESQSNLNELNTKKYEFQTEITIIHGFIISDFKYGEIWNHMFVLEDEKITEITFKDSKNIELIKLTKPRFRMLKDNKFSIRSSAIYLPEPYVGIRYDFKGEFIDNKIVGEIKITYTESDEAGLVLLGAKTK